MVKTAQPVTVSLDDLKAGIVPFSSLLEAFGPDSLGILVVKDLPDSFPFLRSKVLSDSSRLAALPSSDLSNLANPDAKYLVGWSHGVETLKPGIVDTAKGSYYINCAFYQDPTLQAADADKHPGFEEYTAPNIWPSNSQIPSLRKDAELLISLIIDTAILVARACDQYASSKIPQYKPNYLEHVVKTSTTTKARLLHYFPSTSTPSSDSGSSSPSNSSDSTQDDWCATHLDHGCLTGLTSAMYLSEASSTPLTELGQSPSPSAGLYIRSRQNETYRVAIPRDCLAFQTGEALELITQGKFKAVPHFVRGVSPGEVPEAERIARNTLAVFTQPNLDEVVDLKSGLTFGEFARGVVKKNTV